MPAIALDPVGPQHGVRWSLLHDDRGQVAGRLLAISVAGFGRMRLDIGEARQPHANLYHKAPKSYPVKRLNRYTVTAPNPSIRPNIYGNLRRRKDELVSAWRRV